MSHFTVLVVAQNQEELEKKLLPYHEYECTGIEEYTEFVPADMEKLQKDYEEYKEEGQTFEEFIPWWAGYEKNEEGVWGRITNPRARWDWWVVGGRWSNLLHITGGKKGDFSKLSELDIESMRQENTDNARNKYQAWKNKPEDKKNLDNYLIENHIFFITTDEVSELDTLSEEEYVEKHGQLKALTYALVDHEGNWIGRGDMGWWGIDSNRDDSYDEKFWEYLNSLDPESVVYVVDCHIQKNKMAKKVTIRYRKIGEDRWVSITVDEDKVATWVAALESKGYEVDY